MTPIMIHYNFVARTNSVSPFTIKTIQLQPKRAIYLNVDVEMTLKYAARPLTGQCGHNTTTLSGNTLIKTCSSTLNNVRALCGSQKYTNHGMLHN